MITGNKSSAKQLITEIVVMNCQTVYSLPHTDSGPIHWFLFYPSKSIGCVIITLADSQREPALCA